MGSQLGRMLAITLPLAAASVAVPFLAPALAPAAATTAGTVGATAGATGGATAGATGAGIGAGTAGAAGGAGAAGAGAGLTASQIGGIGSGITTLGGGLAQGLTQQGQMGFPTIRAPAQTAAPMGGGPFDIPTPGTGLALMTPGAGSPPDATSSTMAMQTAQNLFGGGGGSPDPFAAYSMAA